ncbi:MAG TPA: hypothetical protein VKV95_22500 [Terriglobia bacterium]|nr:hypothetical protein [Terriglobia bacterium]
MPASQPGRPVSQAVELVSVVAPVARALPVLEVERELAVLQPVVLPEPVQTARVLPVLELE